MTLAIAGQPSIIAYKKTIWWWEMGHLWGWNVLQVAKLRRVQKEGERGNLSAGYSSEKTQPLPTQKHERISFFSPNIALTFFPLFHKNALEEEELCVCFPRVRTLSSTSKSRSLGSVWFTLQSLLMSETLADTYFSCICSPPPPRTNNIWSADCFSSHGISILQYG